MNIYVNGKDISWCQYYLKNEQNGQIGFQKQIAFIVLIYLNSPTFNEEIKSANEKNLLNTYCLMNCTASSYFIPPSINARATSTGALWRIFDILFFKVKFWKIQYSKHSPIQNHYYLYHTSCVSIYRKCWTLIKYHFHISKFSSIKRKLVTT